jgi:muramoyltetrapeptide carboxypeptidase
MAARGKPLPPALVPGARVGVMAPAGPSDPEALQAGIDVLRQAGFEVVPAPNLASREAYLAGSDEQRLAGISALLDADVQALIAARGGYGVTRLLDRMPFARLAEWRGWVVGFSDVTALHAALGTRFTCATLHAPMVTALSRDARGAGLLVSWLGGRAPRLLFNVPKQGVVRPGVTRGIAVGGNLSMLAALVGTPFEPEYRDAVLFLEDVGEPAYRLDRLLTQLRLASRLAGVRAVVVGRLARCGRGEPGWRERWRAVLLGAVQPDAVVVDGLAFGHGGTNVPFPLGAEVEVNTVTREITWETA